MTKDDPETYERTDRLLVDTGGGYLVFRVRKSYHPDFDSWFIVEHDLLGYAGVESWQTIIDVLDEQGFDLDEVLELPQVPLEEMI